MQKLRVGFIVDENIVSDNYFKIINGLIKRKDLYEAPILISQDYNNINSYNLNLRYFKNLPQRILNKVIIELEKYKLFKNPLYKDYGKNIEIESIGLESISVKPIISKSGYIHTFKKVDINKISSCKFDVLIRCGKGILSGDILNTAKFGILSFHHGDNREIRGLPAGFWEVFLSRPSTGFVVQQLTESLDGGNIILRGNIPTSSYWQLNAARIGQKSNIFMLKILKSLAIDFELPEFEEKLPYFNKIYRSPNSIQYLQYACMQLEIFLKNVINRLLGYRHEWNVSFLKTNDFNFRFAESTTIKNPHNRFLADPFLISYQDSNFCFVEDFSYKSGKGSIACYEIFEKGYRDLGVVLEEDFHLSYPYLFNFNDEIYMCPETAAKNEIRIYKCISFPDKWLFEKTIIKNVSAVDSILFQEGHAWYLLTNICSSEMDDRNSELHLYSAESPLSDNWIESPNNPVIFDSQKSRNGGFFKKGDQMFRVNQLHGKARYGVSFALNAITQINSLNYMEEELWSIEPQFFENISGTHHFHSNNKYIAFDHSSFIRSKK
jgi:hypothetical protein